MDNFINQAKGTFWKLRISLRGKFVETFGTKFSLQDKKMASSLENSQRKIRALSCPRPKHSGLLHKMKPTFNCIISFYCFHHKVMSRKARIFRAELFSRMFSFSSKCLEGEKAEKVWDLSNVAKVETTFRNLFTFAECL